MQRIAVTVFCAAVAVAGTRAFELPVEKPYDFRKRLDVVHEPGVRDASLTPDEDEFALADGAVVAVGKNAPALVVRAAEDFVDYLRVSMSLSAKVGTGGDGAVSVAIDPSVKTGYTVDVDAKGVRISAADDRQAAQALYHLEDLMNLRRAPFLAVGRERREPRFSPRMVHSGWGCDIYPETQLRKIAHAGIDTILIFLRDVDRGKLGRLEDVRGTMRRAAAWGIDTYIYSHVKGWKHPDDPDAEEFFDRAYGRIAAAYPEAKGFIVVDENCVFPTKDPHVAKYDPKLRRKIPPDDPRPRPGNYPSFDYPAWFGRIKQAIKKANPDMELVFWVYALVWQPVELVTPFVEMLPKDAALLLTFGNGGLSEKRNGIRNIVEDYTLSFVGPSLHFATLGEAARRGGRRTYVMANTAGLTWDWGTIPLEPCPYQWKHRWDAVVAARGDYGISGVMESHHYGVWPSFITELEKESYTIGGLPFDEHIRKIAARDYGEANAERVLAAWRGFSDAVRDMPPTNDNQYGPFRLGPAFPFNAFGPALEEKDLPFGALYVHSSWWNGLRSPRYFPNDRIGRLYDTPRYLDGEQELFRGMRARFFEGAAVFRGIAKTLDPRRAEKALRMAGLAEFMARGVETAIHVREALRLAHGVKFLGVAGEAEKRARARVRDIAQEEYDNCRAAIELMRRDSRLGWEPTMDYRGGIEAVEWKLRRMEQVYGVGPAGK